MRSSTFLFSLLSLFLGCGEGETERPGEEDAEIGQSAHALDLSTVLATGRSYGVAVAGAQVYFSEPLGDACTATSGRGRLRRVPLGGGTAVTLLSTCSESPQDLVSDGTSLFYLDARANRIRRYTLATGAVTTVAAATGSLPRHALAVNATYVFFADDLGVKRAAKDGSSVLLLQPAANHVRSLAADSWTVFYADDSPVWTEKHIGKVPAAGGPAVRLAPTTALPRSLALDVDHVYWSTPSWPASRVPKAGGSARSYSFPSGYEIAGVAPDPNYDELHVAGYKSTGPTSGRVHRMRKSDGSQLTSVSGLPWGIRSFQRASGYLLWADGASVRRLSP